MLALAAAGRDVESRLEAKNASAVSGSEAGEAADLKEERFDDELMFVMLRGPKASLDRQGTALARRLAAEPGTHVLAPWPPSSALAPLRPSADVAGLVVSVEHRRGEGWLDFVPRTERIVRAGIAPPVQEHVASTANVGKATIDAALDAGTDSEKLAAPILILVLLVVFGSPIAAAVPLVMGLSTVAAGYGVLALLSDVAPLHPVAATLVAMLGLALGVDYSLLLVSRFREELRTGAVPFQAAETALATAGRAVLFAGAALVAAMTITALLASGDVMVAGAVAVVVATVLSVATAVFIVPSALALIGHRIDRWQFRRGAGGARAGLPSIARFALKRPLLVATTTVLVLVLASTGALALRTSPPAADLLSSESQVARDSERVREAFGPGYETTFEVIVDDRQQPLTDPDTLAAIARFEALVERDADVEFVVGLRPLADRVASLRARSDPEVRPLGSSGYLYLAAIDSAGPSDRNRAGFVLNVDEGGHSGRIVVVPKTGIRDPAGRELNQRLIHASHELARQTGAQVRVGGFAAGYREYNDRTRDRIPIIVVALAAMTFVVLVPLLRSVFLPLVAVVLNIATVGVTFALMALLFNTGFLGGPGYTDTFTAVTIITVIFGLAIDYEVFILARVREEHLLSGNTDQAIARGLAATARIVTGAAMIMIAVFLAFGTSDFMTIRQFGVGLAIAVAVDAFVIRLLALPALMRLLSDRAWWLPRWLEARTPHPAVE
ncbi:MAG: MMPL family transporter [Actinomycetota bacterium]|nr:MMPL family transporter [Actinomycetota bacterium]